MPCGFVISPGRGAFALVTGNQRTGVLFARPFQRRRLVADDHQPWSLTRRRPERSCGVRQGRRRSLVWKPPGAMEIAPRRFSPVFRWSAAAVNRAACPLAVACQSAAKLGFMLERTPGWPLD